MPQSKTQPFIGLTHMPRGRLGQPSPSASSLPSVESSWLAPGEQCPGQGWQTFGWGPKGAPGVGESEGPRGTGACGAPACQDGRGRAEGGCQQLLVCPPRHQHLSDVVLRFLHTPLQVGLFLL